MAAHGNDSRRFVLLADGAGPREHWKVYVCPPPGKVLLSPTTPPDVDSLYHQFQRAAKLAEFYGSDLLKANAVNNFVGACARAHADDHNSWAAMIKERVNDAEKAVVAPQLKAKMDWEHAHGRRMTFTTELMEVEEKLPLPPLPEPPTPKKHNKRPLEHSPRTTAKPLQRMRFDELGRAYCS